MLQIEDEGLLSTETLDKDHSKDALNELLFTRSRSTAADKPIVRNRSLKTLAIVCTYLISFGSHYENHLFASIKGDVKDGMALSNLKFHALSAVVALPNTILPFLAGVYIDSFGAQDGSIMASFLIFIGSLLSCLGLNFGAYPLLLTGRAIYGIGGGCIVVSLKSCFLVISFYLDDSRNHPYKLVPGQMAGTCNSHSIDNIAT